MHRLAASLLLLLFNVSLIMPLAFVNPAENVPACCRRDGKHHCAKMAQAAHSESEGGARISAMPTCPLYNGVKAGPVSGVAAALAPSTGATFTLVAQHARAQQAEVHRQISKSRAAQKRGPPALLTVA